MEKITFRDAVSGLNDAISVVTTNGAAGGGFHRFIRLSCYVARMSPKEVIGI